MNTLLVRSDLSENSSHLGEIAKTLNGEVWGKDVVLVKQGREVLLPQSVVKNFPTVESLKERIEAFSQEPNRAFKVSMGCKVLSGALYSAYYGIQAIGGTPHIVSQLFTAKVIGYPLSDGMNGYASSEQLKVLKQVKDTEGINIQRRKIAEATFSFLGGVFLTGGEVAMACGATALSAILSFTMLPLYALGFSASCMVQGKKISLSSQFKKDLQKISSDLSKEDLQKALEHVKGLVTPEDGLQEVVDELGKDMMDEKLIEKRLVQYKNEQFRKFQELERRVGSSAATKIIEDLDSALIALGKGNLEEAKKLLETLEKGASDEILKAIRSIIIGLIILAVFIASTVVTHGATLSLLL